MAESRNPKRAKGLAQTARNYEKYGGAGTVTGVAAFFGGAAAVTAPKTTTIFLTQEVLEAGFEATTGIPVLLDPVDIVERSVKGAFKEAAAKELGTFLKNNADEGSDVIKSRLLKSSKTHQKQIDKHEGWIADPTSKYGDKWESFSDERKANIIHHWKEDIKRHQAYRDAKRSAANELD